MAKLASIALILTLSCFLTSTLGVYARKQGPVAEEDTDFLRNICLGKEEIVKLHFYVQDLGVNHPNTTTYDVAKASITATSPTSFGTVRVLDDLITAGPGADSEPLGRIQGLNTKADLSVLAIAVNLNVYFTAGKYAGSTLSILGRNEIGKAQRELVVAGGTGVFRFARGYAIQSTYSMVPNVSVLEYTIYTTYNGNKSFEHDDVEIAEM